MHSDQTEFCVSYDFLIASSRTSIVKAPLYILALEWPDKWYISVCISTDSCQLCSIYPIWSNISCDVKCLVEEMSW